MSIKLNEPALHELLNGPTGPVAREILDKAERVVKLAQANAGIIMHHDPSVADSIGFDFAANLEATIGIEDAGRKERYLARKEKREPGAWLLSALEEVFPR